VAKSVPKKAAVKKAAKPLAKPKIKLAQPKVEPEKPATKNSAPVKTAATKTVATKLAPTKPAATKPATGKIVAKPSTAPAPKPVIMKPVKRYGAPPPPVVLPHVSAVPTDGKPRKNQVGILSKELELYRDAILAKRREILGDMSSMEHEALRSSGGSNLSTLPLHMADMGTDNYEQEFTLGLMEKDRKLLRDLNDALAKIQNGTYGICEGTGKPISKARLEAQPWARYSIEYARRLERHMH
jgi:DnaK suppressor protein